MQIESKSNNKLKINDNLRMCVSALSYFSSLDDSGICNSAYKGFCEVLGKP